MVVGWDIVTSVIVVRDIIPIDAGYQGDGECDKDGDD